VADSAKVNLCRSRKHHCSYGNNHASLASDIRVFPTPGTESFPLSMPAKITNKSPFLSSEPSAPAGQGCSTAVMIYLVAKLRWSPQWSTTDYYAISHPGARISHRYLLRVSRNRLDSKTRFLDSPPPRLLRHLKYRAYISTLVLEYL